MKHPTVSQLLAAALLSSIGLLYSSVRAFAAALARH